MLRYSRKSEAIVTALVFTSLANAFTLDVIPSIVTVGETVKVTWSRETNGNTDPSNWHLAFAPKGQEKDFLDSMIKPPNAGSQGGTLSVKIPSVESPSQGQVELLAFTDPARPGFFFTVPIMINTPQTAEMPSITETESTSSSSTKSDSAPSTSITKNDSQKVSSSNSRRRRRSAAQPISEFHRDKMVRSKSKSKDPRVLKLSILTTGVNMGPGKVATPFCCSLSARTSPTIHDVDEKTPSLAHHYYLDQQSYVRDTLSVPASPAPTSMYTVTDRQSSEISHAPVGPTRPRTDRQMQIQDQIMKLWAQMIEPGAAHERDVLRERIRELEKFHDSDWALELSDALPLGLKKDNAVINLVIK
ncbi:hypothetical protein K435DRAFT_836968 [Dendrothele bispora CBS 962.96]|uniref:Uncharacterized protein n=1 Tax=Dendrothele bispora (strain CBS 962.96) TaxID=1314807 RepID=A0A4S8MEV1_DENBC|nr:hypothetical protein K435DRAFT_836968 [Dendrothele bispora CBS 962.96]